MAQQGSRISHFLVTRAIGRGGMGVVYLARDEALGRDVALKVLNEYDLPTEERRARFLREARAAAAIRHPNVATIYEIGESAEGHPFIAMEYCEGETLAHLMQRGPIDSGSYLSIAEQMASGLAAAHRKGVIHRDIKSSNIIVEPAGTVKILDFGLAKVSDPSELEPSRASTAGTFFGTVPYLSPEQARGTAADRRSDLFSLGVVLFEMATGQMPFVAESPLGVLEKIRNDDPEPFVPLDPRLPQSVREIISRLLQKEPGDRYQSADDLERDLSNLRREADTVSLPASGIGKSLRALLCYAKLGDRAKSIEYLRQSVANGNHSWYFLTRHPWLAPLQSDPEYQEILRKLKSDLDDVRDDVLGMAELLCGTVES